ncbi:hypothetical protein IIK97_004077 [Salmonella enterica subsp. enterica serovar Nigeria]|nr:hypothetical protein [Salmonella enterica subsp. enterica serovar Nigeria]
MNFIEAIRLLLTDPPDLDDEREAAAMVKWYIERYGIDSYRQIREEVIKHANRTSNSHPA